MTDFFVSVCVIISLVILAPFFNNYIQARPKSARAKFFSVKQISSEFFLSEFKGFSVFQLLV